MAAAEAIELSVASAWYLLVYAPSQRTPRLLSFAWAALDGLSKLKWRNSARPSVTAQWTGAGEWAALRQQLGAALRESESARGWHGIL